MDCDTIYKWCNETSCLQHEYSYLYPASLAMKVEFIHKCNRRHRCYDKQPLL